MQILFCVFICKFSHILNFLCCLQPHIMKPWDENMGWIRSARKNNFPRHVSMNINSEDWESILGESKMCSWHDQKTRSKKIILERWFFTHWKCLWPTCAVWCLLRILLVHSVLIGHSSSATSNIVIAKTIK